MIISFRYPARLFTLFTEDAAKSLIGEEFTAKFETTSIGIGRVLDAKVIDEGRALDLTVEFPDDPRIDLGGNEFSISQGSG